MDAEEALRLIEDLLRSHQGKSLTDLQRAIFRGSWQGKGYKQIHRDCDQVGLDHIMRNVGPKLWKLLSTTLTIALDEPISVKKDALKGPIERLYNRLSPLTDLIESAAQEPAPLPLPETSLQLPVTQNPKQDWGQAPDVTRFWGRNRELGELHQWIEEEGCRLIALYGMAGIGKTTLSVRVAEQLRDRFEVVIWRSLARSRLGESPPSLQELLTDLLATLLDPAPTDAKIVNSTPTEQKMADQEVGQANLAKLLEYLRNHRCLIVLDGMEAVLQEGVLSGDYTAGYEGYGELVRRIGDRHHISCLILTSREKPKEIEAREGENAPVRSLRLPGLREADAREFFASRGNFLGADVDWRTVLHRYDGNPTFLQQVAITLTYAFGHNLTHFVEFQQDKAILVGEIRTLLAQQLNRLSQLEKTIICELAISSEPATLQEIQTLVKQPVSRDCLLEILLSLVRRSLLEAQAGSYRLDPLIANYVTDYSPNI